MSIWSNVSFKACASLLILCFDDLSIYVNGVLKFPTIIVLLSICCEAGLVVQNSLNFCLTVRFLTCPSILNEILAR